MIVSGEERRRGNSSWRTNGQNVKRDSKPWTLASHPPFCATTGRDCYASIGLQPQPCASHPTGRIPLSPEKVRMPTDTFKSTAKKTFSVQNAFSTFSVKTSLLITVALNLLPKRHFLYKVRSASFCVKSGLVITVRLILLPNRSFWYKMRIA